MTAALFARKGEATAEGFVQPPIPSRRRFTPRVRRAVLVLALPVAYLCAATLAVMFLEMRGDSPVRVASKPAARATVPLPPPPLSAIDRATLSPGPTARPNPPLPPPRENSVQVAAGPPVKPVPVAFGVPPAPPLKPTTVAVVGTPLKTAEKGSEPSGARGGYRVQLASLDSAEAVRREWERLKSAHGKVLQGLRLMVEQSPSGAFYRLQAGPVASRSAARKLCATLRRSRAGCLVVAR